MPKFKYVNKKVYRIDKVTGVLFIYENQRTAHWKGFNSSKIKDCCNNKKSNKNKDLSYANPFI